MLSMHNAQHHTPAPSKKHVLLLDYVTAAETFLFISLHKRASIAHTDSRGYTNILKLLKPPQQIQ